MEQTKHCLLLQLDSVTSGKNLGALSSHTLEALQVRYPEEKFHALNWNQLCNKGTIDQTLPEYFDRLVICTHGFKEDVEYAWAGSRNENTPHYSVDTLFKLCTNYLIEEQSADIELVMCYGARGKDHEKNHDSSIGAKDIASSYAGTLAGYFSKYLDSFTLRCYTTAVKADHYDNKRKKKTTGNIMREDETDLQCAQLHAAYRKNKDSIDPKDVALIDELVTSAFGDGSTLRKALKRFWNPYQKGVYRKLNSDQIDVCKVFHDMCYSLEVNPVELDLTKDQQLALIGKIMVPGDAGIPTVDDNCRIEIRCQKGTCKFVRVRDKTVEELT